MKCSFGEKGDRRLACLMVVHVCNAHLLTTWAAVAASTAVTAAADTMAAGTAAAAPCTADDAEAGEAPCTAAAAAAAVGAAACSAAARAASTCAYCQPTAARQRARLHNRHCRSRLRSRHHSRLATRRRCALALHRRRCQLAAARQTPGSGCLPSSVNPLQEMRTGIGVVIRHSCYGGPHRNGQRPPPPIRACLVQLIDQLLEAGHLRAVREAAASEERAAWQHRASAAAQLASRHPAGVVHDCAATTSALACSTMRSATSCISHISTTLSPLFCRHTIIASSIKKVNP